MARVSRRTVCASRFVIVLVLLLTTSSLFGQISGRFPVLKNVDFSRPTVYLVNNSTSSVLKAYNVVMADPDRWIIRVTSTQFYRVLFVLERSTDSVDATGRDVIYVCLWGNSTTDDKYHYMAYFPGSVGILPNTKFSGSSFQFESNPVLIDLAAGGRYDETYWNYSFRLMQNGESLITNATVNPVSFLLPAVIWEREISTIPGTLNLLSPKAYVYNQSTKLIEYCSSVLIKDPQISTY